MTHIYSSGSMYTNPHSFIFVIVQTHLRKLEGGYPLLINNLKFYLLGAKDKRVYVLRLSAYSANNLYNRVRAEVKKEKLYQFSRSNQGLHSNFLGSVIRYGITKTKFSQFGVVICMYDFVENNTCAQRSNGTEFREITQNSLS